MSGFASIEQLRDPNDFNKMQTEAQERVHKLTHWLDSQQGTMTFALAEQTIAALDDISVALCEVCDVAEFCRNVHSNQQWREAAQSTSMRMLGLIDRLNAGTSVYRSCRRILDQPAIFDALAEDQQRMVTSLLTECEDHGVHAKDKPALARNQKILHELDAMFSRNMMTHTPVDIPRHLLAGVPPEVMSSAHVLRDTRTHGGEGRDEVVVAFSGQEFSRWLSVCEDTRLRRLLFEARNDTPEQNKAISDAMAAHCSLHPQLLGHPEGKSYADWVVDRHLLGGHGNQRVKKFLAAIAEKVSPCAAKDYQRLVDEKQSVEGDSTLRGWDVDYYVRRCRLQSQQDDLADTGIQEYFTVANAVCGMSMLAKEVFGHRLQQVAIPADEHWAGPAHSHTVLKFELIPDRQGHPEGVSHPLGGSVGTLFLDLHSRENKYPAPVHFTVRCGRLDRSTSDLASAAMVQRPVVAIVAGFEANQSVDMATLFHEFGHALHSLLCRSRFQHLFGSRTTTDFAEVPSELVERFASDHRVLRRFLRHPSTGQPLSEEIFRRWRRQTREFKALNDQNQVLYALFDQVMFGQIESNGDCLQLLEQVRAEFTSMPEPAPSHLRMGHLVGYKASYYSYLLASVIADTIWHSHLEVDPLSPETGRLLTEELFSRGNTAHPLCMLSRLGVSLQHDSLSEMIGRFYLRRLEPC